MPTALTQGLCQILKTVQRKTRLMITNQKFGGLSVRLNQQHEDDRERRLMRPFLNVDATLRTPSGLNQIGS